MKPILHYFLSLTLFKGLICIYFLSISFSLQSQVKYVQFKPLDVDDGLIHNEVNIMLQDSQGFMWLGTKGGLVRYDGYNFVEHLADNTDSTKLSSPGIEYLFEDSRENLWVICGFSSEYYLHKYDRDLEQFELVKGPFNQCWGPDLTPVIVEEQDSTLWLRTCGGLTKIEQRNETFIKFSSSEEPTISGKEVNTLFVDEQEGLWVGTNTGIYHKTKGENNFSSILPDKFGQFAITAFEQTDDNLLLIGTQNNGLWQLDLNDQSTKRYSLGNTNSPIQGEHILKIRKDYEGYLWIRTINFQTQFHGLERFNPQNQTFKSYAIENRTPGSLHSSLAFFLGKDGLYLDNKGQVWMFTIAGIERFDHEDEIFYELRGINSQDYENFISFYEDRTGKYWLSYRALGLLTYSPTFEKFTHLPSIPNDPFSIAHRIVVSLYETEDEHLWVGGYNGVDRIILDKKHRITKLTRYQHNPKDPASIRGNRVFGISDAFANQLWLNISLVGPDLLDIQTGKARPMRLQNKKNNPLLVSQAFNVFKENDNKFWFGTLGNGVFCLNVETGIFETFTHDPLNENSISSNFCIPADIDKNGNILFLSSEGIDFYNSKTGTFKHYLQGVDFVFRDIHYDEINATIWALSGHGIYKYNLATDSLRIYTLYDGLPTHELNTIIEDDKGQFWISSNKGIIHLNPQTDEIRTYGLAKGLPSLQFAYGPVYKRKNGEIIFGLAGEGAVLFHPDSLRSDTLPPQVAITDLQLFNTSVYPGQENQILQKSISQTKQIVLNHDQNVIGFTYAGLHFGSPQHNQYRYQMDGVDPSWNEVGSQRIANYAGLQPGTYTFKVQASNADGVWNEEGKSIKIRIRYPWWQRWWAVLMYILLLSWGIYAFLRWRTREQRQKIILQERELERERQHVTQLTKVDQLKDQFLANTSHELRTPLQGIIGISESMIDEINNEDHQENLSMIISSGRRLNNLVNDILDFSKLKNEDLQLNRKPLDLRAMIDIVLKNNAPLIRGKELKLINEISANLPSVYADENRLQQILFNLIGNAIKFTEKGYVKISANHRDDMVEIAIEDTGIGICKEQQALIFEEFKQADGSISREFQGTGLGLSITKYLIELHGGNIEVESEPEKGAAFLFTLPVSNEKATTLAISSTTYTSITPEMIPSNSIHSSEDSVHILVVDDEPINQRVFRNHLSEKSFRITQALNGEEAIKIIEEHGAFDLVLLDIMMPRMSGYEVCQKIREQYLISELPVIMVTAKDQLQDIVQGLSLGANDYLPKPFSKEELLARINTQLDLHRIFDVAGRFVPNEFLHALDRQKITEVTLGDHTEREVTVLFTDIRDYTTLSETMTPHENFKFVNAFHGRMGPIIQQHQGFVNQYLGDAIMAIFPDHPEHALYAAIDMQKILQVYNDERKIKGRKPLKMGIGLHTGPLIMGIIGDAQRMDAATISDTVNTASRIESLTKHYGASILLSQNSLANIPQTHAFHFRELGKVQVKGRKEPIGIIECFDGDTSSHIQMKQQTQEIFRKGLKQFFNRQFPDAASSFNQVLTLNPNDLVANRFKQKSAKYMLDGVEEDWKGIDVMDKK